MSLVSTNWLLKNLNNVKIIECSWHMPNANRDSYKEYLKEHKRTRTKSFNGFKTA